MGHKIGFYGELRLIIPKLSLLPILDWSTGLIDVPGALQISLWTALNKMTIKFILEDHVNFTILGPVVSLRDVKC